MVQSVFGANARVYIANQAFSLTDQLNMGIRHIELDSHWWEGAIRICHAGGVHLQWLNQLIQEIAKLLHITIDWDSETLGCWGDRLILLNDTFVEIADWFDQPANAKSFAMFMFDDEEDLETWKKVGLIVQGINYHFGKRAFTPVDYAALGRWPTLRELQQMGKNGPKLISCAFILLLKCILTFMIWFCIDTAVMFVSRTNYGPDMAKTIFNRDSLWTEYSPSDPFKPFPVCTVGSGNIKSFNGSILRVISDSLMYPFEEGPLSAGVFMPDNLLQYVRCSPLCCL
jgi:hypothetical protein